MSVRILIGDCREKLRELPDNSVDSVVCDPPYHLTSIVKRFAGEKPKSHLDVAANKDQSTVKAPQYGRLSKGFMGQTWDGGDVAFQPQTWAEVLRVLKPGGHLIAFSGTRTYHRMAVAIEDAGFEIRDQLAWVYGSGFPKSHDLGDGWGTALKPAWEPIALCRKPLDGTNAANMAKHGVAGLNIDGCRIETNGEEITAGLSDPANRRGTVGRAWQATGDAEKNQAAQRASLERANALGRWPANLCHDGSDEVVAGFPDEAGGHGGGQSGVSIGYHGGIPSGGNAATRSEGSAARFFYCAKTSSEERGEGNNHPTVKPVALMCWLVRLVTPKGGTVLDPFMGSGSTALACDTEQFNFIGCELSAEYAAIAEKRIRDAAGLFAEVRAA